MAVLIDTRCKHVRLTFLKISKAMVMLAHDPISDSFLLSQLPSLMKLQQKLLTETSFLEDSVMKEQGSADEQALFISACAALLTELISQIQRIGTALAACKTDAGRRTLWCLWIMLHLSCSAYQDWSHALLGGPQLESPALRASYMMLLNGVLQCTRSSTIWGALVTVPDLRYQSLVDIIGAPLTCLLNISKLPPAALLVELCALPPDFVPVLCCIVSEKLTGLVPGQTRVAGWHRSDTTSAKAMHRQCFSDMLIS